MQLFINNILKVLISSAKINYALSSITSNVLSYIYYGSWPNRS